MDRLTKSYRKICPCTPSSALQSKQDVHHCGGLTPGVLCDDDYIVNDALQEGPQRRSGLCGNFA